MMLTTIPFPGLYETDLSYSLDYAEERQVEWLAENDERFAGFTPGAIAEALYWTASYGAAHRMVAEDYAGRFAALLDEIAGRPLGLTFESMVSPRYYNFETDRVFMHIPVESVDWLRAYTCTEVLSAAIRERHTSRSGFISGYSNDIADWHATDSEDWDHNEVETLLIAFLREREGEDAERIDWRIIEEMHEYGTFDDAIDCAIDTDALLQRLIEEAA